MLQNGVFLFNPMLCPFSKSSMVSKPHCSSNYLGFSTLNLETTYKDVKVDLGVAESQICSRH